MTIEPPMCTTAPPSLEKGSFVVVSGLKSNAGKKLNGGLGIVLAKSKSIEAGDDERFPVRIYALLMDEDKENCRDIEVPEGMVAVGYKFPEKPSDHKIKTVNLSLHSPETDLKFFEAAGRKHLADASHKKDYKARCFWLEQLNKVLPELFDMAAAYATVLKEDGKDLKAAQVVSRALPNMDKDPQSEMFVALCNLASKALSGGTKDHLQESLDCLLLIPRDTRGNIAQFEDAVNTLATSCHKLAKQAQLMIDIDPEVAQISLKAVQAAYDLNPDRIDRICALGVAHCQAGEWLQGVKHYRRGFHIMKTDRKARKNPRYSLKDVKDKIISAQLQCPGMALEHYTPLWDDSECGTIMCLRREHRDRVLLDELGQLRDLTNGRNTAEFLRNFKVPIDMDDEAFFPASFLEQVQWTGY